MRGIDISHHNGWPYNDVTEKAYNESDFVIVKATQWMNAYKYESFFQKAAERVLKDGKLLGAYHYATGLNARSEAEYFFGVLKPYIGKVLPVLDWESGDNSAWRSKTWCSEFCSRFHDLAGIWPVLYTGSTGVKDNAALANKCPLWFAGYPDKRTTWEVPAFPSRYKIGDWKKYDIWQYTSGGHVDRNTTDWTSADWAAHCGPAAPAKAMKTIATAEDILSVMRLWIGKSRANGTHKDIIDLYNSYRPLARNYAVKYTDSYCAATVSAAFIACDAVELIGGTECSVERFIADVFRPDGIWIEDGSIVPEVGDIICYNWDDTTQPNDGQADHIGIVEKVYAKQKKFLVIEGNMGGVVGRREVRFGAGFIRGYARPKYGDVGVIVTVPAKQEKQGYTGTWPALPPRGYYRYGDGTRTCVSYQGHIKRLQKLINWITDADLAVDGKYGPLTEIAVARAQKLLGVKSDRKFGAKTLAAAKKYKK